jgi:tungstate transport system substrate-binding protein
MFNRRIFIAAAAFGAAVIAAQPAAAQDKSQDKSIVVASTTSTQDSGLFEYLLPLFAKKSVITVKVVAQVTGKALDSGARCDADVVFVHAKAQE